MEKIHFRAVLKKFFEINFQLTFKEFIITNPLADETFYIKFLLNNQHKELLRVENDFSFFDSYEYSFDEIFEDEIKTTEYIENKKKRDNFWIIKEYSLFLENRLTELSNNFIEINSQTASITFEHQEIFKDNAFEIWNDMFNHFKIKEQSRTDVKFMFEAMKYDGLIHSTVNQKIFLIG